MQNIVCLGHQGDIAIFSLDDFPEGERYQDHDTERLVLAWGENSGHSHAFSDSSAVDLFKVRGSTYDGLSFVHVKRRTGLLHGRSVGFEGREEDNFYHHPVMLDPGLYVTGVVEETDWIAKTIRKVVD